MLKFLVKAALGCAVVVGVVQAEVIPVHQTTQWQSLGKETITDDVFVNGKLVNNNNSNNGVFYNLNDGNGWVMLGANTEFELNQTVDFRVDVWKEYQGTHYSDVAKVWIDGTSGTGMTGEWKLADNGNKKTVNGTTTSYYDGRVNDVKAVTYNGVKLDSLGSITFSYTFDKVKDYELIARAMCSADLSAINGTSDNTSFYTNWVNSKGQLNTRTETWATWEELQGDNGNNRVTNGKKKVYKTSTSDWAAFTTTNPGTTYQGEIEMYTIKVKKTNVPEPTMLSLLGCSLLGLAFIRRKK